MSKRVDVSLCMQSKYYSEDFKNMHPQGVMKKLGIVTAVAAGALTTYGVLKVFGVTDKIRLTILDKAIDCYDKRAQEISKKRIIVSKQELM